MMNATFSVIFKHCGIVVSLTLDHLLSISRDYEISWRKNLEQTCELTIKSVFFRCYNGRPSSTVFENHPKCLIFIQFWHFPTFFCLKKVTCLVTFFKKCLKIHFWRFLKTYIMWPNSVTRRVIFYKAKISGKCKVEKF